MTNFGAPVWVDEILESVRDRIVSFARLPADRVFTTLAGDEDHIQYPPADQFVTVTPAAFPADQPLFSGAGLYAVALTGRVRVAVLAMFASDQELRNTRLLTDRSRGVLRLFQAVLTALQGWEMPTAAGAGTSHLIEPMRLESFDVIPKRLKAGTPWAVVSSNWQARFVAGRATLTPPPQPS